MISVRQDYHVINSPFVSFSVTFNPFLTLTTFWYGSIQKYTISSGVSFAKLHHFQVLSPNYILSRFFRQTTHFYRVLLCPVQRANVSGTVINGTIGLIQYIPRLGEIQPATRRRFRVKPTDRKFAYLLRPWLEIL